MKPIAKSVLFIILIRLYFGLYLLNDNKARILHVAKYYFEIFKELCYQLVFTN